MNEFLRRLQEARNTGEWLESRLHLMFTEIADGMFGDGRLTRDERIALSSAIGGALDAFRLKVEEVAAQLYTRDPYAEPMPMDQPGAAISEAADLDGAFVPLVERAVRRDGTIPLRLIQPGWGSSGYYSAEVLRRDGPKVFTPKVKMYWNHPTAVEEAERPEGDLNALAAELVTAARWEESGLAGPGLYADAKVFGPYQEAVNELAPHIGVSIRASGRAVPGEAEGRKGAIIQEIAGARSVDFVTVPGAGGSIIEMFEAARSTFRQTEIPKGETAVSEELQKQLQEANGRLAQVEQQNARLQEALVLREAQEMVGRELIKHTLPAMTQERLVAQLSGGQLPLTEARQLDRTLFAQRITEAVQAEVTYLQSVAGYGAGRIEGVGGAASSGQVDEAAATKRMQESFARMGLNEKEAGHAAGGRLF
jgi:hypothetical protein